MGKNILCALGFVFFLSLVSSISAAPYRIASTTIEIPSPDEFVEVDQRMVSVWSYVQAAQGENRIIAFYIPKEEEWAALANIDVDMKRSMNVQTPSNLQGYTLSEDNFKYLIDNTKLLISEDKVGSIQDDYMSQYNINLQGVVEGHVSQPMTKVLPAHIDRPRYYSYSEISKMAVTLDDGSVESWATSTTTAAILVNGKFLYIYSTGLKDDIEWTRSVTNKWVESIIAENPL